MLRYQHFLYIRTNQSKHYFYNSANLQINKIISYKVGLVQHMAVESMTTGP